MKYRSLLMTAAVTVALAGMAGCNRDVEDRAVAPTEPATPPMATAEPTAPPMTPPAAVPDAAPGSIAGANPDRSAGTVIDDAAVTAKVKAALMAEQGVDGSRINVDTINGRVVLKGEVPDKTMIDRAMQVARGIEGVRDIDNQLTSAGAG